MLVEYQSAQNEMMVNEQLLASIVGRMRETTMTASIETQNAQQLRLGDRPVAAFLSELSHFCGIGFVWRCRTRSRFCLFVAFIDDRVKSAFDIEAVVGCR